MLLGNAIGIPFTVGIVLRGRSGSSAVVTTGTTITFSVPLPTTDYAIFVRCYDAGGNNVDYTVTEKAVTGFKITPVINCTADYIVIFGEAASVRFGSESIVITGTAISFSSVLTGVGYGVLIRCFDSNGNNVDFELTNKAIGGFTIKSAINATIEYIAIFGNTSTVKSASEAVVTAGTTITFDSPLVSTNYTVGIICYDGSGNNVDYMLTEKATTGFKITPAVDGTIEYIAIINN